MNVLKVVVDQIPAGCYACDLKAEVQYWGVDKSAETICVLFEDRVVDKPKNRPPWCPLVKGAEIC